MKYGFCWLIMLFCVAFPSFAKGDATARKEAVVVCGNARFTVLTPQLIRMEWADDGVFEARATMGVVNCNLPVAGFTEVR